MNAVFVLCVNYQQTYQEPRSNFLIFVFLIKICIFCDESHFCQQFYISLGNPILFCTWARDYAGLKNLYFAGHLGPPT